MPHVPALVVVETMRHKCGEPRQISKFGSLYQDGSALSKYFERAQHTGAAWGAMCGGSCGWQIGHEHHQATWEVVGNDTWCSSTWRCTASLLQVRAKYRRMRSHTGGGRA